MIDLLNTKIARPFRYWFPILVLVPNPGPGLFSAQHILDVSLIKHNWFNSSAQ